MIIDAKMEIGDKFHARQVVGTVAVIVEFEITNVCSDGSFVANGRMQAISADYESVVNQQNAYYLAQSKQNMYGLQGEK